MLNVVGTRSSLTRLSTHVGRFLSVGLLVASSSVGAFATDTQPSVPVPVELKAPASAEPILIANPLKRPKEKVPHITYHQKKHYYC